MVERVQQKLRMNVYSGAQLQRRTLLVSDLLNVHRASLTFQLQQSDLARIIAFIYERLPIRCHPSNPPR